MQSLLQAGRQPLRRMGGLRAQDLRVAGRVPPADRDLLPREDRKCVINVGTRVLGKVQPHFPQQECRADRVPGETDQLWSVAATAVGETRGESRYRNHEVKLYFTEIQRQSVEMERCGQRSVLAIRKALLPQPQADPGTLAQPPGPADLQIGLDTQGGPHDRQCSPGEG